MNENNITLCEWKQQNERENAALHTHRTQIHQYPRKHFIHTIAYIHTNIYIYIFGRMYTYQFGLVANGRIARTQFIRKEQNLVGEKI